MADATIFSLQTQRHRWKTYDENDLTIDHEVSSKNLSFSSGFFLDTHHYSRTRQKDWLGSLLAVSAKW